MTTTKIENKRIITWGVGNNFYAYVSRIESQFHIYAFTDNNEKYWGKNLLADNRLCIPPDEIIPDDNVLIIILGDRERSILQIEEECIQKRLKSVRIKEVLEVIGLKEVYSWISEIQYKRIHKFIDLQLGGTTSCNFHCEYCNVWRRTDFSGGIITSEHSPKEFREALSLEKLGGPCIINLCAKGETLLSKDIIDLVYELVDEGHIVSVVTNGTVSQRITRLLELPERIQRRLFFKLSFHYSELIKHDKMETFWNNVDNIKKSFCSYTLEITPSDELIGKIDDIKEIFKEKADGAMPHITFTRDSTREGLDLYSSYSLQEYEDIWSQFGSEMFDLKKRLYNRHIDEYCFAGHWSYSIDAVKGWVRPCYGYVSETTIFNEFWYHMIKPVEHNCKMPYCFNNHAFLALGCVPEISTASFWDIRNRVDKNNHNWVKNEVAEAFRQKLYDNNFDKYNAWDDYELLYKPQRDSSFILFNSPDYPNLGDHAIALGERAFFSHYFPDKKLIEVSSKQYEREALMIRSAIRQDDVILITGGGNADSLHIQILDQILSIVTSFPDNFIVILPQTVFFENSTYGNNELQVFCNVIRGHKNLIFCVREKNSYSRMKEYFGDDVEIMLLPDMAMFLKDTQKVQREGIITCFRDDRERTGSYQEEVERVLQEKGLLVKAVSTLSSEEILLNNRKHKVDMFWDALRSAEIVYTDRLHCMIFCWILGIPCVCFDNSTKKISGVFQWIKDSKFILFCENVDEISKVDDLLCDYSRVMEPNTEVIDETFNSFADIIAERIKQL